MHRGASGRTFSALCAAFAFYAALAATSVQAHHHGVEQVRFQHYDVADGLSQLTIRTMVQDKAGFVWLGTQDGLDRFDGYTFRVYRHDSAVPGSVADNHVTALALGHEGSVWVGTQAGGISRYVRATDSFTTYRHDPARTDSLATDNVSALLVDGRGRLLVGTNLGTVQRLDTDAADRFRSLRFPAGVDPGPIRRLLELRDGSLLIGARRGLWLCAAGSEACGREWRYDANKPLNVFDVVESAAGDIWVASANDGLFRFAADGTPHTAWRAGQGGGDGLVADDTRALLFDDEGRLWVGTDSGLSRVEGPQGPISSWRHDPTLPDSLASNRVYSLLEDRDGLVWVGTWLNGVNVFDPRIEAFLLIRPETGDPKALPAPAVRAVHVDEDGAVWFGVLEGGGLIEFDLEQGILRRYTHDPARPASLASNNVQYITRDRDGRLWIGTTGGLDRLRQDGVGFDHFRHDPEDPGSLASESVVHLFADSRNTLWVGTDDAGLDALCDDCTTFEHHGHDPDDPYSIAGNSVFAVHETARGELMVGLRPGGLALLDRATGRARHFRADPSVPGSLSNNAVTAITESRDGTLWVGTQGGGLNRLVREANGEVRFRAYTRRDGLGSDAIGGMLEDAQGRLWVSTTAGVSRLDPASGKIENFTQRNGAQIAGYFIGAQGRLKTGQFVFGGLRGVTVLDPEQVPHGPPPHRVAITDFRPLRIAPSAESVRIVADADGPKQIELDHQLNDFTLGLSALSFSDPHAVSYDYRLDDFDTAWVHTDAEHRFATYTNLPPGEYVLRTRARVDGGAPGPESQLAIHLDTPPWRSPLAMAGYITAALLILGSIAWQTRQRLIERNRGLRQVAESEERLKLALWGTGDELWDADLRSGALIRVNPLPHLEVNRAATAQTLKEYAPFVHPDDIQQFAAALREHTSGASDYFETVFRSRDTDGNWRWLRSRGRGVDFDAQGHARRVVGTSEDITALKSHEEALASLNQELEVRVSQRTEDLTVVNESLKKSLDDLKLAQHQLVEAEKMAALGGLVAGIAHEINTPLGIGVTAASHLDAETQRLGRRLAEGELKRTELDAFQSLARQSTEIILRNLKRADKLIKSFKQVAVDQSSEQRRKLDLAGYLDEILTSLHPALKKTGHRVAVACPTNLVLDTYPGALYQILVNLVMNSLMHAFGVDQAGEIRIAARMEGRDVVLEYSDNGRGMDEEQRRRVFEPFFTTKRGHGGSGLGMHIVYNLATQMLRGRIDLESAPGKGVRVTLRFPAAV